MKSPIRWAGSKKALVPSLMTYWQANQTRYIEPFCGSACFFFAAQPADAILSDLNKELITTYRTVKRHPQKVLEWLKRHRTTEASYYRLRNVDPRDLSDIELAGRFLFLNRLCFNGIYRTNRDGGFNVPYGHPKRPVRFEGIDLLNAAKVLQSATLIHADFEEVLERAVPGDFVYLDPPYVVAARRIFSEYQPDSFAEKDLKRLRAALKRLDKRGVAFVVSYADSAEGRGLVSGWDTRRVRAKRNIAGFAGARRSAYEVLASNLDIP